MKRVFTLLTAIVLCLSLLTACGKNDDENKDIYIPIRSGNKVNYNTAFAYKGTIIEQETLDATFTTPYYTDLAFTIMSGRLASLNVKQDHDVKEGDIIATLDSSSLEEEITIQKLKLESARNTYEALAKGKDENEIAFAKIDLEIEQAKYDDLVQRREFLDIRAPYDGKITSIGRYYVGSNVPKNATICTIVDTSKVCLSATDNSGRLSGIGFGAKVQITQGTVANTTGTVVDVVTEDVTPGGGFWGGGGGTSTVTRYVIKPDEDVNFESFGSIQVTFTTLRREDTVIVPTNAVFDFGDGHAVNVLINGVKVQTSVTVGIVSGDKTEITSGLFGNETLVV